MHPLDDPEAFDEGDLDDEYDQLEEPWTQPAVAQAEPVPQYDLPLGDSQRDFTLPPKSAVFDVRRTLVKQGKRTGAFQRTNATSGDIFLLPAGGLSKIQVASWSQLGEFQRRDGKLNSKRCSLEFFNEAGARECLALFEHLKAQQELALQQRPGDSLDEFAAFRRKALAAESRATGRRSPQRAPQPPGLLQARACYMPGLRHLQRRACEKTEEQLPKNSGCHRPDSAQQACRRKDAASPEGSVATFC